MRPPFMTESERGMKIAQEVDAYCHRYGCTPWEAFHDPHLGFNLTVMRTADAERQKQYLLLMEQAKSGDEFGLNRMYATLMLSYLR